MSTDIVFERLYPYPRARLWRALTDPDAIADWLMKPTDFHPRVGQRFLLRAKPQPGWRGFVECEVLECEPSRKLSYSWVGNEGQKATTVTWTLEDAPGGTKLRLAHTGFEGFGGFLLAKMMLGPGWRKMMRLRLENVLSRLLEEGLAPGVLASDCH